MTSATRAVLYGRVSIDRDLAGRSVDAQLAECRQWAAREGWQVVAEFRDDGISASRYGRGKARPGWQETLDVITGGQADVLICWEISRATRDRAVWATLLGACLARGVKIMAGGRVHDPADPDDGFTLDLSAALAVRESATTSRRVLRTKASMAAAGRPHGRVPFAYRRVYNPETGALLRQVPDEALAPAVRDAAAWALAGEALTAIARRLTAAGVPPLLRTQPWTGLQVRRLLLSPTYAGRRVHRGIDVGEADWPPIIPVSDHLALVAKLTDPARRTVRDGAVRHLLVGIAICGVCGAPCRRVMNRGVASYSCAPAHHVSRAEAKVDGVVEAIVIERLSQPDVVERLAEPDDGAAEAAREQVTLLRTRLDAFYDLAAAGELSPPALARIEARLLPQIEQARLRARPAGLSAAVVDLAAAVDVAGRWAELSTTARREVVRALLVPVILPVGKGCRAFDPASIEIRWKKPGHHTIG